MNYCKFHPLVDAQFSCTDCEVDCCAECSDESSAMHDHDAGHNCFLCGFPLKSINEASNIVPFWRELNNLYRYPSSWSALIVIFTTALLTALFASAPFFLIFPSIAIMHYCFACLRHTAEGNRQPPGFEASFEGSIAPIFYVFLVMIVSAIAVGFTASIFGAGMGILLGIISVIILPAAILVIAIDEKLLPALNPGKLMGIVAATGTSYFVMLLFILIMSSSVGALSLLFDSESVTGLSLFVQTAISNYYSIIIFHILGYLVYQNGDRLGFASKKNNKTNEIRSARKRQNAKIDVLIKSGRYADAVELCAQQVKSGDANLWQWHRCFKLLLISESTQRLEAFAKLYFNQLDELQQHESMADAYMKIKRRIPAFEIKEPEMRLKVADALIDIGKYKYVVVLLRSFHTSSKAKSLLAKAFNLLGQAYEKIPGQEKNAVLFKQQYERISAAI